MLNKIKLVFDLAFKPLFRGEKFTVFVTVLIMSTVFLNLLFTDAIFSGITDAMNENKIKYQYGDILIEPKTGEQYLKNKHFLTQLLSADERVKDFAYYLSASAVFVNQKNKTGKNEASVGGILWGVDIDDMPFDLESKILEGKFLQKGDFGKVVIGKDLAGGYGSSVYPDDLEKVRVGDSVSVLVGKNRFELTTKGILKTKNFFTDRLAIMPKGELKGMLGLKGEEESAAVVWLYSRDDAEQLKNKLQQQCTNCQIKTWRENIAFGASISKSFEMIGTILRIIGALLAGMVVFVVIFVDMINGKRQLGILKAIGIHSSIVLTAYLLRGMFYVLSGIVFGSFIMMFGVIRLLKAHPIPMPMADVVPVLTNFAVVSAIVFFVLFGFIGALLPARQILKRHVLDLLYK